MPLGFQRSKKRRNQYKRDTSHQRRKNVADETRTWNNPNYEFPIKKQESYDRGGGLSRGRPQASHRKQTRMQKYPPVESFY